MFSFSIIKLPITPTETETLDTRARRHPYSQQVLTAQSLNLTVHRVRQSRRERSADSSSDTSQKQERTILEIQFKIHFEKGGRQHPYYLHTQEPSTGDKYQTLPLNINYTIAFPNLISAQKTLDCIDTLATQIPPLWKLFLSEIESFNHKTTKPHTLC